MPRGASARTRPRASLEALKPLKQERACAAFHLRLRDSPRTRKRLLPALAAAEGQRSGDHDAGMASAVLSGALSSGGPDAGHLPLMQVAMGLEEPKDARQHLYRRLLGWALKQKEKLRRIKTADRAVVKAKRGSVAARKNRRSSTMDGFSWSVSKPCWALWSLGGGYRRNVLIATPQADATKGAKWPAGDANARISTMNQRIPTK